MRSRRRQRTNRENPGKTKDKKDGQVQIGKSPVGSPWFGPRNPVVLVISVVPMIAANPALNSW